MAEKGIQKAFEAPGIFWLPETPQRLGGQLKHNPGERPQLVLIGELGLSTMPVVHGLLDNAACTLFNCANTRSKSHCDGLNQTEVAADLLVVGEHLPSVDVAIFNGLKVRFANLDRWVNFSAIKPNSWTLGRPSSFEVHTQSPITVDSSDIGGVITLEGHPIGGFGDRHIDWKYHNFFEIALQSPTSIRNLLEVAEELQHLLALLTWDRSYFSYFALFRSDSKDTDGVSKRKWSGVYGQWQVSPEERSLTHPLTYLANLSADLPKMISSWFHSSGPIKRSRRLLTSVFQSEGQYREFTFLALMQTVEALHRSLSPRTYMPIQDYAEVEETLVNAIPQNVQPDHRSSLKSRIKYGNDLSLRTRLRELFQKLPPNLRHHVSGKWESFVGRAVDLRNSLTHPNVDGDTVEFDRDEMWQSVQRIKLLLTIVLLNDLGLPFDRIEDIAKTADWTSLIGD